MGKGLDDLLAELLTFRHGDIARVHNPLPDGPRVQEDLVPFRAKQAARYRDTEVVEPGVKPSEISAGPAFGGLFEGALKILRCSSDRVREAPEIAAGFHRRA